MPGNEAEDRFRNLFELNNYSLGQNPSQTFGGDRPVPNYSQQIYNQGRNGAPLGLSLNYDSGPRSDSVKGNVNQLLQVPFDQVFTQSNLRPEFSRNFSRSELLNGNDYMLGHQNFQRWQNQVAIPDDNAEIGCRSLTSSGLSILESHQGNLSVDSPTLTTNSEKSEIAEASSDFNFLSGQQQQQQLVKGQQLSTLQPLSMQQSGFNDMQLLQQTIMFKQLQEMQRQQQLQQFGEVRQQNSLNQLSAIAKQAAGGQLPLLINGTPVRDASQVFMNLMQRGSSPAGQGVPNRKAFTQDQNQNMHSMGLVPQQIDVSLHGTPIGSAGGNVNQYSHIQGMSRDSVNLLTKASGNQIQKPIIQSTFGNPYAGDHGTFSSDNVCMPQGDFISKQGFPVKNVFGQVPPQHGNIIQTNASSPDFNSRQEQAGNLETMQQKTTQLTPSQGLVPLDPLEQKILFNMDDNSWDTSFSRSMDMGAGGFGSALEQSDFSSALQSGSWSALMQSAVGEASSSDTGVQEEWSGLTFQNTELSTDNQPSKFVDEEKQQTGWTNNNLQSASSNSKPFRMFNDSSMSSSFPGFQQSGFQSSNELGEGLRQYDSHRSFQKSPRSAGEWSDCTPLQKSSNQISQQIQPLTHLENTWAGQNYEHSESDMHQRKMASHNNVRQPVDKQKGDVSGAMDKGMDPDGYTWTGQMEQLHSRADNLKREDSQVNHFGAVTNPNTSSQAISNSYEGASDAYGNFKDSYNSKGLNSPKQGHVGQFNIAGDMYKNAINLDQGSLPNFHGSSKVSEELVLGGVHRSSTPTTAGRTVGSNGQNVAPQASQQMLELLHKVDRSRENSPMAHFGTTDHNSLFEVPKADSHNSYNAQMCNQTTASQGFGLKLAPPSQRIPNTSRFLSPQDSSQMVSNVNTRQVNPEMGVKNQGWLDSSSSVRSLPLNEISQRGHWDERSNSSGQTDVSPNLNMQGTSDAAMKSGLPYVSNQIQTQHMSNTSVAGESSQETLTGTASRFPTFKLASSQDTSRHDSPNLFGHPFPVLDTGSFSQPSFTPGVSQKGGMSARLQNAWKNVPTSRLSSAVPSIDPQRKGMEGSSLASQGLTDQNSQKGRTVSSDLGAGSMNSQGSEYDEVEPGKHRSKQEISPEILDTLQSGGLSEGQESIVKHNASHSNTQDLNRVLHGDNHASAVSERNLESFGRSLKASHTLHQNYTLLHQMQAMKSAAENDPSKRAVKKYNEADGVTNVQQISNISGQRSMYEHDTRITSQPHIGLNSSRLNSFTSGDPKMLSFLTNAREELSGKALSQPALQPSEGTDTFNQNGSQNHSNDVTYSHTENSQVNLRMAPMWFKQYGTVRNGQMLPAYDARLAKTAMEQFTHGKSSQNLPTNTSVDQIYTSIPRQVGSILASKTSSSEAGENFSASYSLPSCPGEQCRSDIRAKKRKIWRSERLPWHKEVTQGSQRLQDIRAAEQDWAYATNHLTEKVEEDFEFIGEEQPMHHRSKRRLILTTQLTQQLLRPAPASILLGDVSSRTDSVAYLIARIALGDACSLACGSKNDLPAAQGNSDLTSERLEASVSDKHFIEVIGDFIDRAKKLENDFTRLESASMLDIRVDCQDLERYSVINRFARFHMRGQADTSGTSSSATSMNPPKSSPQKYVTALPMPKNLPEGVQCFSL